MADLPDSAPKGVIGLVAALGRTVLDGVASVGRVGRFAARGVSAAFSPPWYPRQILAQFMAVGFLSLPVVGLTAWFTGAALALNIYSGGDRFNAETVLPQIVALGITRELGPVLAALMLAGLQFGLLVGAIAGAITFIPYVGSLVGGALAIGLALFQFWGDWVSISVVAEKLKKKKFIEGNILTPKLVGKSVGLHPVWLMFALSVFGSLFGFTGMLVAVPVAAALGVLTRFGLAQYQASLLYQGRIGLAAKDEDGA